VARTLVFQDELSSTERFHPIGMFGTRTIRPEATLKSKPTTRSPGASPKEETESERVGTPGGIAQLPVP
jgi:hypothetical protein